MTRRIALVTLSVVATLALAGCAHHDAAPPQAAATPAPAASAPAADEASLQAILASADAKDGESDHVVKGCTGCKLGMPGNAEHSVQAHGYTLEFCSDTCKTKSESNLDAAILALK